MATEDRNLTVGTRRLRFPSGAGACLSLHGLGPRPRRERRYSAPETARGQGVLPVVPAHGLRGGEPVHAGADGPARAEGRPALY